MAHTLRTTVLVNSLELIDSQAINLFEDAFEIVIGGKFRIHFLFKDDAKKKSGSYCTVPQSDKEVTIEIYNYIDTGDPLRCYLEPLEVGRLNGRKLYINFSVAAIWNHRVLTYNLYVDADPMDAFMPVI